MLPAQHSKNSKNQEGAKRQLGRNSSCEAGVVTNDQIFQIISEPEGTTLKRATSKKRNLGCERGFASERCCNKHYANNS